MTIRQAPGVGPAPSSEAQGRLLPPPDLEVVRGAVAALQAANLEVIDIDSLKELLLPLFTGYCTYAHRFKDPIELYRSVRYDMRPESLRHISYPPAALARMSRVNRQGVPVFYAATHRNVAFFEQRLLAGDHIVVGRWKTSEPVQVMQIGHSQHVFQRLQANRHPDLRNAARDEASGVVEEFLATCFTTEIEPGKGFLYKLPIAVAEKFLVSDLFDGILYPSIAMRANADNIALNPAYVDRSLKFVSAEFVRVDKVLDFKYEVTVLDFANEVRTDGSLVWLGRRPNWKLTEKGQMLRMIVEDGRWVARTAAGDLVEPS